MHDSTPLLAALQVPDLWQQEAVQSLRQGFDVIIHAPTGAGKTRVFELYQASLRGRSIYTVPTRALANDKRAEWRANGWDTGIATGDLAENLSAKIVVATLETQKSRILAGRAPALLVVDEYQMLADSQRGVNYELALAMAPAGTQLLLLSGSVANPRDVAAWLERGGRRVRVVETLERPVPLEETQLAAINTGIPQGVQGHWPRLIARAVAGGFAPVLIFAPRRNAAEKLATQLAAALPQRDPLVLSPEQTAVAGETLAKLLRARVAFHHSGMAYQARAGVVEPLAKAGQLRVVVATMGLAAGVNFSMRSVLVTDRRYFHGPWQREVQADELLQMFGRAGRRGLDETGHALTAPGLPQLADARAKRLKRVTQVDWAALMGVMHAAAEDGADPFAAALRLNERLFTDKPVPLGIEISEASGPRACGLRIDRERALFVRPDKEEMLNSRGEWEPLAPALSVPLSTAFVHRNERWIPALRDPLTLEGTGFGNLARLRGKEGWRYGREMVLASWDAPWWRPVPSLKKRLRELPDTGVDPWKAETAEAFQDRILPWIFEITRGGALAEFDVREGQLRARIDYGATQIPARMDSAQVPLVEPQIRSNIPPVCQACDQLLICQNMAGDTSPAMAWRRMGLIGADGRPTRRGAIFSFFNGGEGLAVAAALEEVDYPIAEMIVELANLRAGPRFSMGDWAGASRLGGICRRVFEGADEPGYLELGVPPNYGEGAADVLRMRGGDFGGEGIEAGDIERARIEWLSLLRHITEAPEFPWDRWNELRAEAARFVKEQSATRPVPFPLLTAAQMRPGYVHRL